MSIEELFDAAERGDVDTERVSQLLEMGVDANAVDVSNRASAHLLSC